VTAPVQRAIETDYRHVLFDNHRWSRFTPRPGDIFVCTPAKCGTTWMQTIVVELLFPDGSPGPVMDIAPWIDARFNPADEMYERIEAQTYRRQVKTHTPADGIPWFPDASYIAVYRDGRDVFMSFLNHMRNIRPDVLMELAISAPDDGIELEDGGLPPLDDVHAFFDWWLDSPAYFPHLASFWEHRDEANVLFVHYDDLKADLDGEMRRVAAFLAIDVDPARWTRQVERCTFASMKGRPDEIADFDAHFVGGADTFLYKGTNGRWRDVLTPDELARFERTQAERLPPDAIEWLTGSPEERKKLLTK
jgi:aryl sulfotransferase